MHLTTQSANSSLAYGWLGNFLLAVAVLASSAASARAQEYRSDPIDEAAKRESTTANVAVRDAPSYAANSARVQQYFTKYYFPQMTQTSGDALGALGDMRYNLFKRYLWATTNEALQRDLTNWTLKYMGQVLQAHDPPYHPAVRYNAVLIIGMLDSQYAIEGQRPPIPLLTATKALTTIVNRATEANSFPPPVILGALIGLERHAQYSKSLEPATVSAMTAALLKLVNHEQSIQEMDRETYSWLRLRAATVLSKLGAVGQNNAVYTAILNLAGKLPSVDDRCAAAALLAKLQYEKAKVDSAATADTLLKLARDVSDAELKRADEFESARVGGAIGGFAPGQERLMAMQQLGGEEFETFPRRLVLARLTELRTSLTATKPLVDKEAQAKFDAVIKAIEPVIKTAADKERSPLNITQAVRTMGGTIAREAAPPEKPLDEAKAAEAF